MTMKESTNNVWIELIVNVSTPEISEVVSDILISTLGRGILVEDIDLPGTEDKFSQRIKAYLNKDDLEKGLLKELEHSFYELEEFFGDDRAIRFETRTIVEEEWSENWKKYFKPVRVGQRLVIKPSWEQFVPSKEDIVIEIDPGQAFGTGTHASTVLILEAMERIWTQEKWERCSGRGVDVPAHDDTNCPQVLDVGTGTGILGIAAAKLGASSVLCLDIDPIAVKVARDNFMRNHVHDKASAATTPLWQIEGSYDVILANLDRDTILLLADDLSSRLAPSGRLILSGILTTQADRVEEAFTKRGLVMEDRLIDTREGEWTALVLSG